MGTAAGKTFDMREGLAWSWAGFMAAPRTWVNLYAVQVVPFVLAAGFVSGYLGSMTWVDSGSDDLMGSVQMNDGYLWIAGLCALLGIAAVYWFAGPTYFLAQQTGEGRVLGFAAVKAAPRKGEESACHWRSSRSCSASYPCSG